MKQPKQTKQPRPKLAKQTGPARGLLGLDWHDRGTWTLLSLGGPMLFASAVIVWGYFATENHSAIPDPNAAPIVAITAQGNTVPIPPTERPATPTPGLNPGAQYRIEGVVVDELGAPLSGVCLAIGPNGCQEHSPRTDGRGVYFVDFPAAAVEYDLHFTKDGYKELVQRLRPTQNQVLNLVLPQ